MIQMPFCEENFLSIIAQNDILKRTGQIKKLELEDLFNEFQNYKNGKVIIFCRIYYRKPLPFRPLS